MTTALEYALMAGASYISTRDVINKFPVPDGWVEKVTKRESDTDTGFEATYFTKGTEIVISYAGTYPLSSADLAANLGMATGIGSFQLQQAVDYYLQVKADNPSATSITLTGHSLGGGLAALVGVFFGVSATTFDQAPFANSAQDPSILASLNPGNALAPDIAENLKQYLLGKIFAAGTSKAIARDAMVLQLDNFLILREANEGIPNSNLINTIRVDGEFTSSLPVSLYAPIGNNATVIDHGPYFSPSIDLHDQALLTTFLQSEINATINPYTNKLKSLSEVTKKLTDLLGMFFDKNLYAQSTDPDNKTKEDFLNRLVRHEAGGISDIPVGGDAMVTRFTSDLWKLAQEGGMTLHDGNTSNADVHDLSNALIAFAMQKYYEEKQTSAGYKQELFTDIFDQGAGSGGIHFDLADVSDKLATAANLNQNLDLSEKDADGNYYLKGYKNFEFYLNQGDGSSSGNGFTVEEQQLIKSMLPYLRDWYVQAGANPMNATDALGSGAFILGGTGNDNLTGGAGADLLVGNAGDDVLTGGFGSDVLIGGKGNDTYVLQSGQGAGIDTLFDKDDTGKLLDGSSQIVLTGGAQYGDTRVFRAKDASGVSHLYTYVTGDRAAGGDLIVDGAMLIKNYQPSAGNHMGMTFDNPAADINPIPTTTLQLTDLTLYDKLYLNNATVTWHLGNEYDDGSYYLVFEDSTRTGTYAYSKTGADITDPNYRQVFSIKNPEVPIYASAVRTGNLSAGNDHLIGSASDDLIYVASSTDNGGNDLIEAGAGHDLVTGGSGNDVISGGVDSDILNGGEGNDRIYADAQISTADAIAAGNPSTSTGQAPARGDWLAGGKGDDTLIGSTGYDVLMGGAGADLLIAGAGDDYIMGDTDWVTNRFEWTVTEQPGTSYFYPLTDKPIATIGGADVIYAGSGNDHVWGEFGNDVIFGEGGNDVLQGGSGNDIILGGAGVDYLYGEGNPGDTAGVDYLDGGAETDVIFGGAGNDIIIGGTGDDFLYGETGQDTYIFNRGDGNDDIYDTNDNIKSNANILRFGAGISSSDVTLRLGSLMLDLGNGDAVHLKNIDQNNVLTDFDRNDVFNSASIGSFEFADGTVLTTTELLARGFDLDGTAGDDVINGTNTLDRINGLTGNDTLIGGAGDDTLNGGTGNDLLQGGSGNDVYLFDLGGGQDILNDTQGANTIRFGAGVLPANITFTRSGYDLVLGVEGANDQLTIHNWGKDSSARIARVEFANDAATVWDATYLQTQISPVISGTAGDDIETAWFDQNTLMQGQSGNDTLLGSAGNDTLDGGAGNDLLNGGSGANTYVLNLGSGQDIIEGTSYRDNIVFGAGITAASLTATRTAQGLLLSYGAAAGQTGDSVLIGGDSYPDQLRFADGSHLTLYEFIVGQNGYAVTGSTDAESLVDTFSSAISFTGGQGNDLIMGGGSNTTYHFNQGDGTDSVVDLAGQDTFAFGAGISVNDISFAYEDWGDASPKFKLYYGASDVISILNGERGAIEQYRFANGSVYSFAQLAAMKGFAAPAVQQAPGMLIQPAISGVIGGTSGNDTIYTTNDYSSIIAGGKGDDYIQVRENDGDGLNRLLFDAGDGNDTINVVSNTNLVFGAGIDQQSLLFSYASRTYQDYKPFPGVWETVTVTDSIIHYGTQGDSIVVEGGLAYDAIFEFADGGSAIYGEILGVVGGVESGGGEGSGSASTPVVFDIAGGQQTVIDAANVVGGASFRFAADIRASDLTFQQQGADMLVSFTANGAVNGSLLLQNYDLSSADVPPLYSGPWLFMDGSSLTIACGNNYNGTGSYGINQYDASGRQTGAQWVNSDGTYGNTIFNLDDSSNSTSYRVDGSFMRTLNDGKGNITDSNFDVYGVLVSDTWRAVDGSYGSDSYNADGTGSGIAHYADGSSGVVSHDGAGNVSTLIYNTSGVLSGARWIKADGTTGIDAFNNDGSSSGTVHNLDGSYSTYTNNGYGDVITLAFAVNGIKLSEQTVNASGDIATNYYSANGNLLSVTWQTSDGSHGTETYNLDGSDSGISYNPDGSYYTYTNDVNGNYNELDYAADAVLVGSYSSSSDGQGNYIDVAYDASGKKINDWWGHADGTYGNDTFNMDGSSAGSSYSVNGSYSSYTNDGLGDISTSNFDTNGIKLSDSWSKPDGTYGSNTYHVDGSYQSYSINSAGTATDAYYSSSGQLIIRYWSNPNGSSGSDTYNADGSHRGYSIDAAGTSTDSYYNAAGQLTVSYWSNPNGSSGSDTYSADGSHRGYSIDAAGTSTDSYYNTAGQLVVDYWSNPNGSSGSDTYNADGSHRGYSIDAAGTSTDSYFNTAGQLTSDYWVNASGLQGGDVYTYNADGSYFQQWTKNDGSSGTLSVNSAGVTFGESVRNADGSQNVSGGLNHLIIGSATNDSLVAAGGNDILIGGTGNDTITTGSGADIIAFNKGDGQDTLVAPSTGSGQAGATDNTISLGGGIQYANLAMSKSGNNLIFSAGNGDQITLQNWYANTANHSVANLQIVLDGSTYDAASSDTLLNQQVQTFNFATLASNFDQALAANPTLTSWGMTDALLTAHLAGSDTAALGGDLAYQYNLNNSLTGIGLASAQTVMNDANFGTAPQTLKPLNELQVGVKLG